MTDIFCSQQLNLKLEFLLEWKKCVKDESLRFADKLLDRWVVTIKSVIALPEDLIEDHEFEYVIPRKMNPDKLEVCSFNYSLVLYKLSILHSSFFIHRTYSV